MSRPLLLQIAICAGALALLAAQPAAGRPVLVVPLDGVAPSGLVGGDVRLVGTGIWPGSLILSRAPRSRGPYLILGASRAACGDIGQ